MFDIIEKRVVDLNKLDDDSPYHTDKISVLVAFMYEGKRYNIYYKGALRVDHMFDNETVRYANTVSVQKLKTMFNAKELKRLLIDVSNAAGVEMMRYGYLSLATNSIKGY